MKTLNDYRAVFYRMEIVEDKDGGGFVSSVVHFYWIIESAKRWIMECVNEHSVFSKSDFLEN